MADGSLIAISAGAHERRGALLQPVWLLIAMAGAAAALGTLAATDPKTVAMLWGGALVVGGLSMAFLGDRRFDMFSPVFFFGMSFAIHYGIAAILPYLLGTEGLYSAIITRVLPYYPQAAVVTFGCLVGFFAGYRSRWVARAGRRSRLLLWRLPEAGTRLLWSIMFGLGVLAFALLIVNDAYLQTTTELRSPLFYSTVGFIQYGLWTATAMAVMAVLTSGGRFWRVAAMISVAMALLFGLPSGSKTLALLPVILAGMAWNYARGPLSRGKAAAAVTGAFLALGVLFPLNHFYRAALLTSGSVDQTLLGAAGTFLAVLRELRDEDWAEVQDVALDYGQTRLSHISVVANILRYQDEGGELRYGATYARLLYALVPRIVWPDKPPLTIGKEFAVELGYTQPELYRLGREVSVTSVGITMLGEQVYNFSALLAPIGMVLLGALYRWLYEVFRSGFVAAPVTAVGVYAVWWYGLVFFGAGSNFAANAAGGLKFYVFIVTLLIALKAVRIRIRHKG